MQIKLFLLSAMVVAFGIAAPFVLAKDFKASIVTYPGIATAPLKLMIDAAAVKTALGTGCVNPILKAKITGQNTQKTAARFDTVKLLFADGTVGEINKANKSDALAATPFTYAFDFPLSSVDSAKGVAGISASFIDAGGDDSSGKVVIAGANMNIECQVGNACIALPDTLIVAPPIPPPQIGAVQNRAVVVHVGGDSATSAGPLSPGTVTDGGEPEAVWTTSDNAKISDNIYSAADPVVGGNTNTLQVRNFGFSIPSTATINGIEFIVELKTDVINNATDNSIKFVKAGTAVGTDFSRGAGVFWPTSDTNVTFGGSTQLAGVTWTPADINNTNFGVNISGHLGGTVGSLFIDYVSAKVYYTTTGASVYDAFKNYANHFLNYFFCFILDIKCK